MGTGFEIKAKIIPKKNELMKKKFCNSANLNVEFLIGCNDLKLNHGRNLKHLKQKKTICTFEVTDRLLGFIPPLDNFNCTWYHLLT